MQLKSTRSNIALIALVFERIDELELHCKYGNKEEAVEVGKRMKKRLISIEHYTDEFP